MKKIDINNINWKKAEKNCYTRKNIKLLNSFKDKYKDKRVFIIGNGPSLTTEDLDKLTDEVTFATNRIFALYDKTKWRPSYYFCQDTKTIINNSEEIKKNIKSQKFMRNLGKRRFPDKNTIFYYISSEQKEGLPQFSSDITKCVYEGATVSYSMIQFAVYMGFKEIYLLGMDCNYTITDGKIAKDSYPEGMYDENKSGYLPEIEYNIKAYKEAKKYTEDHNIKIYNATRGGKLEVFERIDLDKVLRGEK